MKSSASTQVESFNARVRAFAQIHTRMPSTAFAANLHTQVETLSAGEAMFPVTVNDAQAGNAWVCSPHTTYGDYALEEAVRYAPRWLSPALNLLGRGSKAWLRSAQIDRAVAINNWLLSTNLYPPLQAVSLASLLRQALARWPGHAIWLRSLNDLEHRDWLAECERLGFALIPSRQVYVFHDVARLARERHNLKIDLKLAAKQPGRAHDGDIVDADYPRIAELYERLYMDKYSRCNPHYNAQFMRQWHRAGLLEFDGYRDEAGLLLCIAGQFRQGHTLTTPIVGYDTDLPQRMGLYRLLTACTFEHAIASGFDINFSAGAAGFKRLRGGTPSIEYSAVYMRHLPRPTRRILTIISALTRRAGVPIMRRFEL
ncbi:GNAT family N-acetyltransferase [Lysobacter capsici]|uniref:GNAT family N-acetyltransferase n=1 Tax=Lysobacter capsici TaxID=435897 RepID=UPI001C0050EE|nr:GNAT family N-acetyltransferase [Lysobacter capsici]QWF18315.1 GNAT family N-acetyltransferase [Lysobacter capsici]